MNKKFSTLLAVVGLATSSFAMGQATDPIVKGDYYHLETQSVGSGSVAHLVLTQETADGKAALAAVKSDESLALTDSALWKVDYTLDVTSGQYSYTLKNKATGAQLSFAAGSNVATGATITAGSSPLTDHGTKSDGTLSGSLMFNWGSPLADGLTKAAAVLSSYIPAKDSTLSLAAELGSSGTFSSTKSPIIQVMTKGNVKPDEGAASQENPILAVKAVRAAAKKLTGTELNNMLGTNRGFQLFFSYKNQLTTANNALAGVVFEAVTDETGDTPATLSGDVMLKAKTFAPKKSGTDVAKPLYAYIDTVCYDAATPTGDGTKLTFKVDTIPTTDGSYGNVSGQLLAADAYTFNFYIDPSAAKDSVAVFVTESYNLTSSANPPRTYEVTTGGDPFPLQIAPLAGTSTDKLVLTTGSATATPEAATLPAETRISFTGGATLDPLFDAAKVYSVKVVNDAASYATKKGKYMVVAPISAIAYGAVYSSNVFDHLPSTQFVFDGGQMVNRELEAISTYALYPVEGKADVYTNLTDTFEIKAMANVNVMDSTMGWSYISADSLTNYAFSLNYVSGILEGRSINAKADSAIVATTEEGKLFKLEAVNFGKVNGAAEIDEVKTLYNQAYKIYTKDKKFVVVKNGNKLALTSVTSVAGHAATDAFYLKETENKGEYILVESTNKYNVNSTNETLETVGLNLSNNAFAVQVEKAPGYVLDAKGHYNIENLRGDMLAADAQGFGMFRKEGELKAAYEKVDFALYIDTAKIHPTEPSYFILSGAKTEKGTSKLEGNFLRVMTDSIAVEGYKAANGLTRLAFVPAKREATSDSLLVNYQKETFVKGDSVGYKGKQTGIEQFRFKIQYTNVDGEYLVKNDGGYLATYNDVLCLTASANPADKAAAQLIKLTTTEAPTANEGVEVSEVKVIAGEGQVTIAGAQGKKVVISNILGQVVANTVITSSDAVIAAPAGVVVVAVEGEAAVKAIVK